MRKILLVEDDEIVRAGIKSIINRSETEFREICECSDGIAAKEKLKKEKFDLVITDIKMPNMDGLSFIKDSQGIEHKPKFIILSGYRNFNYAAEALKYGVREYLLKPVGRKKLMESINKIEIELKNDEKQSLEKGMNYMIMNELRIKELNRILLSDSLSESEIGTILNNSGLVIFDKEFYISLLILKINDEQRYTSENKKAIIDSFFKNYMENSVVTFFDEYNNLVIFSSIKTDFNEFTKYLRDFFGNEFYLGLGEKGTSVTDIQKIYLQACESLKYKLIIPSGGIINYSDTILLNKNYKIPVNIIKKILEIIGTKRIKEIDHLLGQIFNITDLSNYHIGYIEKTVENLNYYIIQHFIDYFPQKHDVFKKQYYHLKNIHYFNSIQEYITALKGFLMEIDNLLKDFRNSSEDTSKMDVVIRYINDNYSKNLDLSMVSNYVSLNYFYFSNLFRKQTGMRFMDYLLKTRIVKAKELLENTNDMILEIAGSVGFQNPKHFTKMFKIATGVSPYEYRKKLHCHDTSV